MNYQLLVTGGAGYIGSHTTRQLLTAGFDVLVVDDLTTGHRWAVAPEAGFVECNAGDYETLRSVFETNRLQAIVHFAGSIVVPESVRDPLKYYRNNCGTSQTLVRLCREFHVPHFLFSSSAAVYGQPARVPVSETAPTVPINPYGRSKLITEWLLADVAASAGPAEPFSYMALRYFNVAGAALDGTLGQATPEATHLIKVACEAARGKRDRLEIFGDDYPTADGTCVRDYIHVEDLAAAHVLALRHLLDHGTSQVLNCGYGHGYSVREVIEAVRAVSGRRVPAAAAARRAGDPAELIADNRLIRRLLDWNPQYDDLELICRSAYEWELKLAEMQRKTA